MAWTILYETRRKDICYGSCQNPQNDIEIESNNGRTSGDTDVGMRVPDA